jgi:hypothetical protein
MVGLCCPRGPELRVEGKVKATACEGYELGETALQLAIVILSIALIAQSWLIVLVACAFCRSLPCWDASRRTGHATLRCIAIQGRANVREVMTHA